MARAAVEALVGASSPSYAAGYLIWPVIDRGEESHVRTAVATAMAHSRLAFLELDTLLIREEDGPAWAAGSSALRCRSVASSVDRIADTLRDMAFRHCDLFRMRLTNIPMKARQKGVLTESREYDVPLALSRRGHCFSREAVQAVDPELAASNMITVAWGHSTSEGTVECSQR